MPTYEVEMHDGRRFHVEADRQPSEAEIMAQIGAGGGAPASQTPAADAVNGALGLNTREPENYAQGFSRSIEDTGVRTLKGVVKGLNPLNLVTAPIALARDLWDTGGAGTWAGLKDTAGKIASGDPEAGGEAIGNLAMGKAVGAVLPRVLPAAGPALSATGDAVQRAGVAARSLSPYGLMEAAVRADPRGAAVAALPYAAEGTGRLLSRLGRALTPAAADDAAAGAAVAAPEPPAAPARVPMPGREGPPVGPRPRALSVGEERGINELDRFYQARYGDEGPPVRGNGTYRDPAPTDALRGALQAQAGLADDAAPAVSSATPAASAPPPALLDALREQSTIGDRATRTTPALASRDLIDGLVEQARGQGFDGDPATLRSALRDRADIVRSIDAETAAAGGTPQPLLREIAKAGGLSRTGEQWSGGSGLGGELSWLRESSLAKSGVLRDRGGLPVDKMVEYLQQDPRFQHLDTPNALISELQRIAAGAAHGPGPLSAARLGATGAQWWHDVLGTEPPAAGAATVDPTVRYGQIIDTSDPDVSAGRELGRLLQKLASGRGGQP